MISASNNKAGTTLRLTKMKNIQDEKLSHEFLLTTRQKTKISNDFDNNVLTDIKLSWHQLSKKFQSGGFVFFFISFHLLICQMHIFYNTK